MHLPLRFLNQLWSIAHSKVFFVGCASAKEPEPPESESALYLRLKCYSYLAPWNDARAQGAHAVPAISQTAPPTKYCMLDPVTQGATCVVWMWMKRLMKLINPNLSLNQANRPRHNVDVLDNECEYTTNNKQKTIRMCGACYIQCIGNRQMRLRSWCLVLDKMHTAEVAYVS
jgi:hypothetical protein